VDRKLLAPLKSQNVCSRNCGVIATLASHHMEDPMRKIPILAFMVCSLTAAACTIRDEKTVVQRPAAAPAVATANCGVETWSTDKMTYVNTPCSPDITYENPGYK
jgi:hypothetical protein